MPGATHVVQAAHVGAAALLTQQGVTFGANAGATAVGVSTGASSSEAEAYVIGDFRACPPSPLSGPPPSGCGAPVLLDLLPVNGPEIPPNIDVPSCVAGQLLTDEGTCRSAWNGAYTCAFPNYRQCADQCSRGSAKSCNTLGYLREHGVTVPQDLERADEAYRSGCFGGDSKSCANRALLAKARGKGGDEAQTAINEYCLWLPFVCAASDQPALVALGAVETEPYLRSLGMKLPLPKMQVPGPRAPNVALIRRGCRGGDLGSCLRLRGLGVPR